MAYLELVTFSALVALGLLVLRILNAVTAGNAQLSRLVNLLAAIEERQKHMNDKLYRVERHTQRAVRDSYERDEQEDRQPPV